MRLLLVFLVFFPGFILQASDPPGVVRGKVFDKLSLEPLPAASVIYKRIHGTTTDENGRFLLRTEPGHISLTFQYVGYKTVIHSVTVRSNDTTELDVGLDIEIAEIDQIVVSANKVEQRVSELTVSVSVIRPEAISGSHVTDVKELINKSSGIEVMDGQASVRGGSGFSYGAGSRVLTLIDGLPALSADAGNIKWQYLPLENISQIEIIKGASSVLYGSSALNGIINFRTADPSNDPVTSFFAETGVFDKPKQKNWIWWDSPRTFSSLSFSHMQKSGNTDIGIGSHILTDMGYRRLNEEKLGRFNLKLKHSHKAIEGLVYGLKLHGGMTKKRDFVLWEDAESGALKQDESTAIQLRGNFFALDPFISLSKKNSMQHDLRMRIQSSQNRYPDAGRNNSDALSFLSEYQFWYRISHFLSLTAGFLENYSRIISNFYGDHHGLNLAAYTQVDISPAERLKLVSGLRAEYNSLDGVSGKMVPLFRAGINYRLMNYTFLRASFGQGYRYPSIAEKHAATTLGSVRIVPNPAIQPESGWNSEIGIKQGILTSRMNGQIDLAVFYLQNTELIEYIFGIYPDPGSETFSYGFMATNVEQSRVYGFENEFVLNIAYGRLNPVVTGGYVFMYPVEFDPQTGQNTGVYLKYRRKHSGKLSISTSYGKFEFGLSLFARSGILNIDDVFLSELTRESILPGFYDYWMENNRGYFLIDQSLGYQINKCLKLSLAAKNLTNTEYMGRPGDIMPQRNFSFRLSGRF